MPGEPTTVTQPALDEETRAFVRRALEAGLVELGDFKKVVVSLMAESNVFTPQRLADGLVGAGILTSWQAHKLLAGKSKGFYLGSYRLLRPLGKGGMGVVYLGEHHVMKRLMALKILPPEALQDPRRIARFKEEARASAQLDHPNIVRAYDFAEAGGKVYIVMEYVEGIDLHYAIARDGVTSIPAALDVLQQASEGLAHAHERGIVHRDIKPSNLMLRTDGVIKISDMGLARVGWAGADDAESQRRLMGTADYVAPEQAINSKTVDARADIYSLGCTMYYLLAGRPPFEADTIQKRLAHHQTTPPPDIREVRSDCPAAVADLIMRMMAKRPEDRPKSAAELLIQLKRLGKVDGDKPQKRLSTIAKSGDTVVDDSLYQATIDDTSLSSDGEIPVAEVAAAGEIDFSDLPPVDLGKPIPRPNPALQAAAAPRPVVRAVASPAGTRPGVAKQGSQGVGGDRQQLMLGIGLTVAVLALVGTLAVTVVTFMRPESQKAPTIKAVEDGKGGRIIVVSD